MTEILCLQTLAHMLSLLILQRGHSCLVLGAEQFLCCEHAGYIRAGIQNMTCGSIECEDSVSE